MQLWLKLTLGAFVGTVLGALLPWNNETVLKVMTWAETAAVRLGGYVTLPLVLFSFVSGAFTLLSEGKFWSVAGRTMLIIACSSFVLIAAAIGLASFVPGLRIPLFNGGQEGRTGEFDFSGIVTLFPENMLAGAAGDGAYLASVVLFAFFLALGLSYEKERSAPLVALFHAAARCFYHLAGLFTEVLSLVFIVIAAYWAVRFHGALVFEGMQGLLVLVTVFTAAAGLVVMPLLVFFFVAPREKFGATLLGVLGQTLTAFFSGSITFSLPVLFRSANENFHIRRSAFGVTAPLCAAFGRAGSTAIAAAAFLILLRSYSPLVLGPLVILIVFGLSLLFTPLLSHRPGDAVWAALASFCVVYGSGYETAYLALQPVAFYLITLGAFLDTLLASFITLAIAVQKDFIKVKKPWQPK